ARRARIVGEGSLPEPSVANGRYRRRPLRRRLPASGRSDFPVDPLEIACEAFWVEVLLDAPTAVRPHLCAQTIVGRQGPDVSSQAFDVVRLREQARPALLDELAWAAVVQREHGFSHGHRFDDGQAESLFEERHDGEIARGEHGSYVGADARENDLPPDPQLVGQSLQARSIAAVTAVAARA